MQYSPAQFRRVQHQFLQEFQLKTLDFYDQNVNSYNLIEYKKILNQIKTKRKQTISKKKKFQWLHKRGTSIDNLFHQKFDQFSTTIDAKQDDQQDQYGFYLTQNVWPSNKKKNQNSQLVDSKENIKVDGSNSRSLFKSKAQITFDNQDNQNLNIDNLNDRIYGQYSVLQCLRHQQSQVQQAIFCFKKRITALQEQVNSEDIKQKQVDRLLVQNNNQMLRAKHTNQQVKSSFLKTKKHFDLDLQGRKQIQLKFCQKNKQQFDESIVNHIYMKKMKHHVIEQQKKIIKLDEIRHELEKKQKKYKSIYLKEQGLYKAYEQIKGIDPAQFTKKPIVSILDKDFDELQNKQKDKNHGQKSKNKKNRTTIKDTLHGQLSVKKKLSVVVKQIIEHYRQMKHQQASKISEFKLLINERDQKQAKYIKTVSRMSEIYQILFQQIQIVNPQDKLRLQQLMHQVHQISIKKNFINTSSNGIQYRLKFYLSKQLNILKKIISTWLKSDKLANKYIQSIFLKFCQFGTLQQSNIKGNNNGACKAPYQQQIQERQLSVDDSRNMLISCFENWQNYLYFLDILHQSSYIYRFMSKSKLFKLFKRIIKTKISHKNLTTQDIFQKALQNSFEDGKNIHIKRIENLLSVFRDFYNYLTKVQSGSIRLNCAINYDTPVEIQQTEPNELSKLPSRNQLERFSTKKQLTLGNDRNSTGLKMQNTLQSKDIFSNFSEAKKFVLSNMKDEDMITQLKKKKQLKPVLNIHEFYEDLREEIQKVNKISSY